MKTKVIRTGNDLFTVTVCEDGKKRWLELPSCKIEDDCDLEDLTKLLASTLEFLENPVVSLEEVEEIV